MTKEKIFRNSKNSVFLDLFSIPEYLLQLVKTLHTEMAGLKEEVMDIMFILFDQDYNTKLYGIRREIIGAIKMCKDFGLSIKDSVSKIAEKFGIAKERAERYVNEFWNGRPEDYAIDLSEFEGLEEMRKEYMQNSR